MAILPWMEPLDMKIAFIKHRAMIWRLTWYKIKYTTLENSTEHNEHGGDEEELDGNSGRLTWKATAVLAYYNEKSGTSFIYDWGRLRLPLPQCFDSN